MYKQDLALTNLQRLISALSAGSVEYIDFISAEG